MLALIGASRQSGGHGAGRARHRTKMPQRLWLWLPAALILAAVFPAFSAPKRIHYTVNIWTVEDGLPESTITSMVQTHDGYLWLGTLNGLVRFDGYGRVNTAGKVQFTTFDENNTPALSSSRIVKLFEDSAQNLWVGTESAGIALVGKNGRIAHLDIGQGSSEGKLASIAEDKLGGVWLYTANGQLARYKDRAVNVWSTDNDYRTRSRCRSVISDAGQVCLGVDWSISCLDPQKVAAGQNLPDQKNRAMNRLDFLLASKTGGYWVIGDGKVEKWKAGQVVTSWSSGWSNAIPVNCACEDQDGNLIVGTDGQGAFWFDPDGHAEHLEGLSHSFILSLVVDREGCLWVGTNGGGLHRVKRQAFSVVEASHGYTVQSAADDLHGGLWIGYNGDRIDHWSDSTNRQYTQLVPESGAVRAVFVDKSGEIFAATDARGILQFTNDSFQGVPAFDIANQQTTSIFQDHQGFIWVGTQGGLACWNQKFWRTWSTLNGLSTNSIRAIAEDKDGYLWAGTYGGGLNRIKDGNVEHFSRNSALPSSNVSCLLADADGILWVGTGGGLARFAMGKWTSYTARDGLVSDSINYLLDDGQGNLWIGSNAGLMRVPKAELNAFATSHTNAINFRSYGMADGLPTSECSAGSQPAACRSTDGRLWFPTIKGLASLSPEMLKPNSNPPPVVIEGVRVGGDFRTSQELRAPLPTTLTLPAGKEQIEIDYTSLNLLAPERTRFQYRMEGHEETWTDAGNVRAAHFSKLPPGHFTFRVRACNEDGIWNETGATLAFIVLPPFWQTWWFLSGTTLVLLALVAGIVHVISTQRLQRQLVAMRQQEALEKERARIARDLHDQLGANLTQVALLGELAEADKNLPEEVESHAKQICNTARETTRALDEIVWTVNPSNDTLDGLVNYICKYAQEYLALAGLKYRLEVPSELPAAPITPEVRHNMFLAAKEAVNNVVKHSQATSARIRLLLQPESFTFEIEDNGRGIPDPKGKPDRSGLKNMRKRMEDIGGSFAISPGSENGAIIRLTAPLKK